MSTTISQSSASSQKQKNLFTSLGISALSLVLAIAPIPWINQKIVILSGTELQEPLQALREKFQQANPNIQLELQFQGSQDIVNRYVDNKNEFTPTVLIPANAESLKELQSRWQSQNSDTAFYNQPKAIAKTMLVGVAWAERGKVLFPNNQFNWNRIEQAMQLGNWKAIGGNEVWGSFDFVTTDPTRSNSGQLTIALWAQSKLGNSLTVASLNNSAITSLFGLIKRSVYQPAASTDILMREFITRGENDADLGIAYESVALSRWQQSRTTQGKPYQIYYFSPTIETISTAAIAKRNVDGRQAEAAQKFIDFLLQPEQQSLFVQYGFRPIDNNLDLKSVPNSPWSQDIAGVEVKPNIQVIESPSNEILSEIKRLWDRAN
ncbi:MAG: ABC transporter substrate-binding protein [Pseudanabaena sp.]|nr:MAG: ABC transporter substrate-binding protein [Pseudanabaena sp.]